MFWHTSQFEIKPKCSVCKPQYSKSKKGHYLEYTCHFEIINILMEASQKSENPRFSHFFHASVFHSLSRRSSMKWHRTSNVSHYAKLRRAVPVSPGAPSFMADMVMVQPCSPALLLWEQALPVLPGLFCLGFVSQRLPWGLLNCQYNLHFCASLCSKFSAFACVLHKLILWTKMLLGLENGINN